MRTPLCDELGIEFPIFAFTHCRDVVAAVSKAGGFGVLGAVGFTPEQLEVELQWIDEHIGDRPYGVDIVIPGKYEGMDDMDPEHLAEELRKMVPQAHVDFADKILADHGVPELPPEENERMRLLGWTAATAMPQIEVALAHPKVRLIANALGTPPQDVIDHIHEAGLKVAALCGSPYQALKHRDAGVDIVIAQGGEGGGHTGDVGSIVLWPQVAKAIAPTPMLAAGGIGSGEQIAAALALGAQGVWAGSLWLTVEEADLPPAQKQQLLDAGSRDTVRVPLVHRQAVPHAQERLDRGVGGRRHARPAPDADAVHGVGQLRGPRPSVRRQGPGCDVQPGRSGRRAAQLGREDGQRRAAPGRGVPRRRRRPQRSPGGVAKQPGYRRHHG